MYLLYFINKNAENRQETRDELFLTFFLTNYTTDIKTYIGTDEKKKKISKS